MEVSSVSQCNIALAEQLINEYASAKNDRMLKRQLSQCEDVREELLDQYVEGIQTAYSTRRDTKGTGKRCESRDVVLRLEEVKAIISQCNKTAAITRINSCLDHDDAEATLSALRNLDSCLPSVHVDDAALFFHEEIREVKFMLQKDLVYSDLVGALSLLNAMVDVCVATRSGEVRDLWAALSSPKAFIQELDEKRCSDYLEELRNVGNDWYIGLPVVQECVDNVNMRAMRPNNVKRLNVALSDCNVDEAIEAMRSIENLRYYCNDKWRRLQVEMLLQYREVNNQGPHLRLVEICDVMKDSGRIIDEAERLGNNLQQLSRDVISEDALGVATQLEHLSIPGLEPKRVDDYARTLINLAHNKVSGQQPRLVRGFVKYLGRTIDVIFSLDSEELHIGQMEGNDERFVVDMRDIECIIQMDNIQQEMDSSHQQIQQERAEQRMDCSQQAMENAQQEIYCTKEVAQQDMDHLQQDLKVIKQETSCSPLGSKNDLQDIDSLQQERAHCSQMEMENSPQEVGYPQQELYNAKEELKTPQQGNNSFEQEAGRAHCAINSSHQIDGVQQQVYCAQQQMEHLQLEEIAAIKIQAFVRGWIAKKKYNRCLHFRKNLKHVFRIQRWWRNVSYERKIKEKALGKCSGSENVENYIKKSSRNSAKEHIRKVESLEVTSADKLEMTISEEVPTVETSITCALESPSMSSSNDFEIPVLEFKEIPTLGERKISKVRISTSDINGTGIPEINNLENLSDDGSDFHVSGGMGSRAMDHLKNSEMKDLLEELKCRVLKENVARMIKTKQNLEKQIAVTDTQIGLLVKNRISLQQAPEDAENIDPETPKASTPKKKLEKVFGHRDRTPTIGKVHCSELDTYEKLFYKLQTNPKYLYRLISSISANKLERFEEQRIFSIFQFGSDVREQYLLLNFFQTALECEVRDRVNTVGDITSGKDLPILQMIIQFYRNYMTGPDLEMLMQALVSAVMEDHSMIDTNPVNVYRKLVGNVDAGVSSDSALQNKEVWSKIKESISSLKHYARMFLAAFNDNVGCLPYGYRFTLRTLKQALEKKFPEARPSDIFKAVGHILYDKALSPIIKRPCSYLNLGVPNLIHVQQINLNQIDCILQYAVAKKGFGSECAHLQCLNSFIISCHEKFKTYLEKVCDVEELEGHFHWDHLSEATLMYKPQIGMAVEDLMSLHLLLKKYEEVIVDSEHDPLLAVLQKLGPTPPSAQVLLSEAGGIVPRKVHLALNPQVDVSEKQNRLLIAKQFLNDLLLVYPHSNPNQILNSATSQEDEALYVAMLLSCDKMEPPSFKVEQLKENVKTYLRETGSNSGQLCRQLMGELVRHRDQRRLEIQKMKTTLNKLQQNVKFCEEQVQEYNQYLEICLENQSLKQKKHKKRAHKIKHLKYNGTELKHRGILDSLSTLREKDLQHIIFHISAGEKPGSFLVQCTMLGAEMDVVELRLQELLELQYHGKKVVQLFGQVNVCVNEVVHLLNRKFLCS